VLGNAGNAGVINSHDPDADELAMGVDVDEEMAGAIRE
jgi:hypothetical protein